MFGHSTCDVYVGNKGSDATCPDPANFEIQKLTDKGGGYIIARIRYPDCTNYNGDKILLFKDMTRTHIESLNRLDPHFSDDRNSPIARFKPTGEGFRLAMMLVDSLLSIENMDKVRA